MYLSAETIKLNLEHHYWLKDTFLSKVGRMAPNLTQLCLRRTKISDESFEEMMWSLNKLEKLDIADC